MNHLPYDAFNGCLVEQDLIHVVGNEKPPCKAIKWMAIGEIRPQEVQATEVEAPWVAADLQLAIEDRSSAALRGSTAAPLQQ
jgi:hypothetical protein